MTWGSFLRTCTCRQELANGIQWELAKFTLRFCSFDVYDANFGALLPFPSLSQRAKSCETALRVLYKTKKLPEAWIVDRRFWNSNRIRRSKKKTKRIRIPTSVNVPNFESESEFLRNFKVQKPSKFFWRVYRDELASNTLVNECLSTNRNDLLLGIGKANALGGCMWT